MLNFQHGRHSHKKSVHVIARPKEAEKKMTPCHFNWLKCLFSISLNVPSILNNNSSGSLNHKNVAFSFAESEAGTAQPSLLYHSFKLVKIDIQICAVHTLPTYLTYD